MTHRACELGEVAYAWHQVGTIGSSNCRYIEGVAPSSSALIVSLRPECIYQGIRLEQPSMRLRSRKLQVHRKCKSFNLSKPLGCNQLPVIRGVVGQCIID